MLVEPTSSVPLALNVVNAPVDAALAPMAVELIPPANTADRLALVMVNALPREASASLYAVSTKSEPAFEPLSAVEFDDTVQRLAPEVFRLRFFERPASAEIRTNASTAPVRFVSKVPPEVVMEPVAVTVVAATVLGVVAPTVPLMLIEAVPVRFVTVPLVGVPNAPLNSTGAPALPVLTARAVAMPVPRPETPVLMGRPVQLVRVPL